MLESVQNLNFSLAILTKALTTLTTDQQYTFIVFLTYTRVMKRADENWALLKKYFENQNFQKNQIFFEGKYSTNFQHQKNTLKIKIQEAGNFWLDTKLHVL